jgi:hypothetical protein
MSTTGRAGDAHGYVWRRVSAEAPFAPRDGAGALVHQDRMWLLGGWNPRDKVHFPAICNSEVWSSADGRDWQLVTPHAPWEGRHTVGYAVHRGRMWLLGGDAQHGHYQNDVWSSADGVRWDLICPEVPWKDRVLHYTAVHDGKLWVMGGQTMGKYVAGPDAFYNDVWCSADGATWRRVTPAAPWAHRGMIGGSAVHRGRIWLLGGGTYDTPAAPTRRFYNDVWSSADGRDWTQHLRHASWAPRQYHDVAVYDGRLWVMEGWDGAGNRNDVHSSADGETWSELPATPWAPRHAASVFVHRDSLWVVAGNNMTSDVWRLTRRDV